MVEFAGVSGEEQERRCGLRLDTSPFPANSMRAIDAAIRDPGRRAADIGLHDRATNSRRRDAAENAC